MFLHLYLRIYLLVSAVGQQVFTHTNVQLKSYEQ